MNLNRVLPFILTTEQGSRFGLATAALFAVLALMSLLTLFGGWWSDVRLSSLSGPVDVLQSLSSSSNELLTVIPQAHLFGYRAPDAAYIPITSSEMRLTGVTQLGSEDDENAFSRAIISVQGGIGKVFQVGDVVQEGVKLTSIQADAVVLDNNGHSERLPLQRATLERS